MLRILINAVRIFRDRLSQNADAEDEAYYRERRAELRAQLLARPRA